jgi:hypothetical protein
MSSLAALEVPEVATSAGFHGKALRLGGLTTESIVLIIPAN